jgi:hypothetical protein
MTRVAVIREQKQVIHLRSPGQLRRFLREHCARNGA